MSGRRIAVLVACYNRRAHTMAAMDTLFRQQLPPALSLQVLLVDDGSSDGTSESVAEAFPSVRILKADGSLFWNGAMTLAQQAAMAEDFDFHLWLNDDVTLAPEAISVLVALHDGEVKAGRPSPIVVGGTSDPEDGTPSYGGHVRRAGLHPFRFQRVFAPQDAPIPCDAFNGNCVLVPRWAFMNLGPIDPAFSGGQLLGDTDYGLRAGRAGIPVLLAPHPVGTCGANRAGSPWQDSQRALTDRLASLRGPLGPLRRQTLAFYRNNGGRAWVFWWAIHAGRCLYSALRPPPADGRPVRLALVEPVLAWYRLGLLLRLAMSRRVKVTVFHGTALPGGEGDCPPPPGIAHGHARNFHWPWGGDRVLWCGNVWSILAGAYDVVLLPEHVYTVSNWLVWLVARLRGRPRIILTGHFKPKGGGSSPVDRLRRFWIGSADYLAPYTESGARQCRSLGVAAHRIVVLRNTLDVEAIRAAAMPATPPDRPTFLFVGRLYQDKRVPLAAEAMAALVRRGHSATLLVVGEGEDGPVLERLAAAGYPLRLLGACRDPVQLAQVFAQAGAVILPDAAGLAVVHAFAHGIPVILGPGDRHGVEAEYVIAEENGLWAETLTAEGLADQMERLLTEPVLAARLRQGAIQTADTLSMDDYARRLVELVERAAHA